jgi:hypothetical protein
MMWASREIEKLQDLWSFSMILFKKGTRGAVMEIPMV